MKKGESKENILSLIKTAAVKYQNCLVGRHFLYIADQTHLKILFRTRDFLHLTGVETTLSPMAFYKDALSGRLQTTQFDFSDRHPYDLSIKKLQCLVNIDVMLSSPALLLSDINTVSFRFPYGITEKAYTLCLHINTNLSGKPIADTYIPRSLRSDDASSLAARSQKVDAVFAKRTDEKIYTELVYRRDNYDWNRLPPDVVEMVSPEWIDRPVAVE